MTAPAIMAPPAAKPARTVESVLAHAHLRLGALSLARVELETMAGLGLLDARGLVDLAEVRWRTGDLLGAGEAANAALRGRTARWSPWSSPPRRRPPSAVPARRGGWPTGCWPAPRPWSTGSSPACRARACGRVILPSRHRRPRPCSIASQTSRRGPTGTHHAPTIGWPPSGSRSRRRRRRSCSGSGTARPTSSPRRWQRQMRRPSWMRAGPRGGRRAVRRPFTSGRPARRTGPCAGRPGGDRGRPQRRSVDGAW